MDEEDETEIPVTVGRSTDGNFVIELGTIAVLTMTDADATRLGNLILAGVGSPFHRTMAEAKH